MKLTQQLLELIGGFGDPIEAGIEEGRRLKPGDGAAPFETAVGIAGHAAVALDHIGKRLVSPVGGLDIGELADAGDLLIGQGVTVDAGKVEVGGIGCNRGSQGREQGDDGEVEALAKHGQGQRHGKGDGRMQQEASAHPATRE